MSKLAVINEILNEKFKPANQLDLIEDNLDKQGRPFKTQYRIVSGNIPYSLFRYNPEETDIFPFYSQVSNLKKVCDYRLFAEEGNYLYVFLIELKKSNLSARKQLRASKVFVNYIIDSARRIGKDLDENIAMRMIRICVTKLTKRVGREQDVIYFDKDGYCDYLYNNFRLKNLMHY